ncbi:6114_t:CDS:2, partial [Entrophospora sp. SA101]
LDHTIKTSKSVWDSVSLYQKKENREIEIGRNKNVIELGSGKSIPSITISILGVNKLMITDMPSVIPEIKKIIKLNNLNEKNITVKPLNWMDRPWDYIIASDIVWIDYLIEPLIETLDES